MKIEKKTGKKEKTTTTKTTTLFQL